MRMPIPMPHYISKCLRKVSQRTPQLAFDTFCAESNRDIVQF